MVKCIRYRITEEMAKVAQGKKTKLPSVEFVIFDGLRHHPTIQKKVGKAFGIR